MLETDLEMDEEGMTVPYPPFSDNIRKNYGFVDVRGRPELASQISEGLNSPAMRNLLVELAQPGSKIFSVGCDLGTSIISEDKRPYTAGGYVQVMDAVYADRSPEDYARFAEAIAKALQIASQNHEWRVHFVLTPVAFKVDGSSDMTGSLWVWFHAFADSEEPWARARLLSRSFDSRSPMTATRRYWQDVHPVQHVKSKTLTSTGATAFFPLDAACQGEILNVHFQRWWAGPDKSVQWF